MKILFEKWQDFVFLKEEKGIYQIYCDMDGVLVDFVAGALEQINLDVKNEALTGDELEAVRAELKEKGKARISQKDLHVNSPSASDAARAYMYKRLAGDKSWWAHLPWMSDGQRLWNFIKKYDPLILTTPMKDPASEEGKLIWVEYNLGIPRARVLFSHKKYEYAMDGENQNILIDDFLNKNVIPYRDAGGNGIYHTSADSSIEELKKLGF
jgi:5'(3')-deoxyribonucleotidase